ncbi:hypothetical protein PN836_017070 [Ningiella sp. W23]|uniref:hypothetical protein n=1 Tax=Ningiella sp. W23 TaxID=3023715 RepID=UPI0037584133
MKQLALASTVCLLVSGSFFANSIEPSSGGSSITEPSQQSIKFFKTQVANNRSVGNALSSLLQRYPEKTGDFLSIAFTAYPDKYEEIISASVSTNPMFIDQIIMVANQHKISNPAEIVKIAVNAEPSYAEITTREACKVSPDYFNEIIKTAVHAEPDSADQIAQRLVKAYPNKTMEILVTTIKEVPYVGKYILDALLATVDEGSDESENMIIVSVEQLTEYPDALNRLVALAHDQNIDAEKVRDSAIKGGLSEDAVALLIEKHYTEADDSIN